MPKMRPPYRCRFNGVIVDPEHAIPEHREAEVRELDVAALREEGWSLVASGNLVAVPTPTVDTASLIFDADDEED